MEIRKFDEDAIEPGNVKIKLDDFVFETQNWKYYEKQYE